MSFENVGRNEPCPCGSGKKFKRCHGFETASVNAAPQTTAEASAASTPDFGGVDPMMAQNMMEMMRRLPKGQMIKLQGLIQKAMAGKDVTKEMEQFQTSLPREMQELIASAPKDTVTPDKAEEITPKSESKFKSFWKKMRGGDKT